MSDRTKQLQNVMECSEMMLRNAESGDWDKVINIESQRSVLLENLFSSSCVDNSIADMDEKIKKIIEINAQLESITLNARDNTGKEISSISQGRKAVNVYTENSV